MNIKDLMKTQRLLWFGHVWRREIEEDIKSVCKLRVEGTRILGTSEAGIEKHHKERSPILFPQ